jgi:hypothetical protein
MTPLERALIQFNRWLWEAIFYGGDTSHAADRWHIVARNWGVE